MKTKYTLFLATCSLLAATLACQGMALEETPATPSTQTPESTSISSASIATNTAFALPAATLTPPLGLFPGKIAFTDTTGHLALLDMLTDEITPLTKGDEVGSLGSALSWSGDGSRLAYLFLNPAFNSTGLAILDIPSGKGRIVLQEGFRSFNYSLSPDGSFAIFDTFDDNGDDIWRLDMNSGEGTLLTANEPFQNSDHSTLSPDGTRFAYQTDQPSEDIWIMKPDGSGKINLTPDDEYYWSEFLPAWSPDGARVAFFRSYRPCNSCTLPDPTQNTRGWPPGLWVVNADGSGETLIVELPLDEIKRWYTWLSWSPDGRYLAYYWTKGAGCTPATQIRFVEVATGTHVDVMGVSSGDGCPEFPTWSPDSRALMVNSRNADGEATRITVYVAAVDGSGVWTLFDAKVAWSAPFIGEWTLFTAIGGYNASWSP